MSKDFENDFKFELTADQDEAIKENIFPDGMK